MKRSYQILPSVFGRCVLALLCLTVPGPWSSIVSSQVVAKGAINVPSFSISVVRPTKLSDEALSVRFTNDGFEAKAVTLDLLLQYSYAMDNDQLLSLPKWATTEHFDVLAKVDPQDVETWKQLNDAQQRSAIRLLIAERFSLRAHMQVQNVSVYELTIDNKRDSAKLFESVQDKSTNSVSEPQLHLGAGTIDCDHISMNSFATVLSGEVGHTVIDKTGAHGIFSFKLKWNPLADADVADPAGLPDLFTAIREQLGLHLTFRKNEVSALVIEKAEVPTTN